MKAGRSFASHIQVLPRATRRLEVFSQVAEVAIDHLDAHVLFVGGAAHLFVRAPPKRTFHVHPCTARRRQNDHAWTHVPTSTHLRLAVDVNQLPLRHVLHGAVASSKRLAQPLSAIKPGKSSNRHSP